MQTYSTRQSRPGEEDTFEHIFISQEEYKKRRAESKIWSHLAIYGAYYGIDLEKYKRDDSPVTRAYITIVSPLKEYIDEIRNWYDGPSKLIFMDVDPVIAALRIRKNRPINEGERASYDQSLGIEDIRSQSDIIFTPTNVLEPDVISFISLIESMLS